MLWRKKKKSPIEEITNEVNKIMQNVKGSIAACEKAQKRLKYLLKNTKNLPETLRKQVITNIMDNIKYVKKIAEGREKAMATGGS